MPLIFNGNTPKQIIWNNNILKQVIYNGTLVWKSSFPINTNVEHGIYSGATEIDYGGTAIVTISADTDYLLPSTITVENASYTWNSSTGLINLNNATDNVSINVVCYHKPLITYYRCIATVSNAAGNASATSNSATITVNYN